jgi:hypothetical protein
MSVLQEGRGGGQGCIRVELRGAIRDTGGLGSPFTETLHSLAQTPDGVVLLKHHFPLLVGDAGVVAQRFHETASLISAIWNCETNGTVKEGLELLGFVALAVKFGHCCQGFKIGLM